MHGKVNPALICCPNAPLGTRRFLLTFVNTTAIAYHQNYEALTDFLPICNSIPSLPCPSSSPNCTARYIDPFPPCPILLAQMRRATQVAPRLDARDLLRR